jgi:hypothetical protein
MNLPGALGGERGGSRLVVHVDAYHYDSAFCATQMISVEESSEFVSQRCSVGRSKPITS